MALGRVKTWSAAEILTAADLNGEFNNILNNALSLISPLTGGLNCNLKTLSNLVIERVGSLPGTATAGRIVQLSTDETVYIGDGSNWLQLGSSEQFVRLSEQGSDPTAVANKGFVYVKDDGGDTELYYRDDSGNVVQITQDGSLATSQTFGIYNFIRNSGPEFWGNGTAVAPNGYVISGAGSSVAREGTIVFSGTYSAKLTRNGADTILQQRLDLEDVIGPEISDSYFDSRQVTLSAWVWASVASRARLILAVTGTTAFSSYHTGGSSWERLTVTATGSSSASAPRCGLQVDTGDTTAYLDSMMLTDGSAAPAGYAPNPSDSLKPIGDPQGTPVRNLLYMANVPKAWVNFAGSTSINASFNIASVADNGVGDFTITIDRDMADANYVVTQGILLQPGAATQTTTMSLKNGTSLAVGSFTIVTLEGANAFDSNPTMLAIMGNQ